MDHDQQLTTRVRSRGGAWSGSMGYRWTGEDVTIKAGRRAKVYKEHGLWWCHSYHVHISGIIRRISIREFSTYDEALRTALICVGIPIHIKGAFDA